MFGRNTVRPSSAAASPLSRITTLWKGPRGTTPISRGTNDTAENDTTYSDQVAVVGSESESAPNATAFRIRRITLMDDGEISSFLAADFVQRGYYAGRTYTTKEALDQGRELIVAEFEIVLQRATKRVEARIRQLQTKLMEIEGVSEIHTRRLQQEIEFEQRDAEDVALQLRLCRDGQGWITKSLADYGAGFVRANWHGLKQALGEVE